MSDRTQTSEAPEPERTPAVTVDPAPAAPVGGLALGQLGSVDAVLALQQSSGNQAVDRVLRGQAAAGETMLPGALGAALTAARPSAKPAPRMRADTVVRHVADDVGPLLRNAAAGRLPPEARAAQSHQASFAADAGEVTATAGGGVGGFSGSGFFGPAGLEGGVASYSGPAGATAGHRIAADAGAGSVGDDADEGSGDGLAGTTSVDSGAAGAGTDAGASGDEEMDSDVPGDGADGDADADADAEGDADADADAGVDTDSGSQFDPGGADQLVRLRVHLQVGGRAVDYFAEQHPGATAWVDTDRGFDADRAACEATRELWARRQREHTPPQPRSAQLPGPSGDDAVERRRQVEAFRDMTGARAVETAGPGRNVATATIDKKEAARARNDATRALLLAWTSLNGETRQTREN